MTYPIIQRVVYKKNPLYKVICQLRYPPILRIDTEVPSQFQDALREKFPLYNERVEMQQQPIPDNSTPFSLDLMKQLSKPTSAKNHEFSSEDNLLHINLTRTFVSISTSSYTRWEDFSKYIEMAFSQLIKIYSPQFFTRIGIRYLDIFDRSKLGLKDVKWADLLQPYFLGLLSSEVGTDIRSSENIYEINLPDSLSILRIMTSFVESAESKEQCYMVDSDFYTPKRILIKDTFEKLNFLHERATSLIQWIITDRLHQAMEPEKIMN